jgi:hypothetical protein
VRCIDRRSARLRRVAALAGAVAVLGAFVAGCTSPAPPAPPERTAPAPSRAPAPPPVARAPAEPPAGSMDEVRRRAALKTVQANPGVTYTGKAPRDLLAVQVLEIELNGDGSVRRIRVLRKSEYGEGTIDIARAAIERAAPFGDVRHLRKPWTFVETFLFTEDRRFKPRILEQ